MYDDVYLRSMSRNDIMSESEESRREVLMEHLRVVSKYRMEECILIDYCDIFFSCDAPMSNHDFVSFMSLCDSVASQYTFDYYESIRDVLRLDDTEDSIRFKWHVLRSDKGMLNQCMRKIVECYKDSSITYLKALTYAYVSSHGSPIRVISDFFSDAGKIKTKDIEMYTRLLTKFSWCTEAFMTLTLAGYTFANMPVLVKKINTDNGDFPYWEIPEKLIKRRIEPCEVLLRDLPEIPKDYVVPMQFFS